MSIVAKIAPNPVVTVRVTGSGLQQTATPITIKNIKNSNRLDQLSDVDASGEIDGGFLVYDAASDKYVVRQFELAATALDPAVVLDGGDF